MAVRQTTTLPFARADRAADRTRLLAWFGREMAAAERPVSVLAAALPRIASCLNAEAAAAFGRADGRGAPVCLAVDGPIGIAAGDPPPAGFLCADDRTLPGGAGWGVPVRSLVRAPLAVGGTRLGAICALNRRDAADFDDADAAFLEAASCTAALAMVNAWRSRTLVEQDATRRELELAAEIQRNLLPRPDPRRSPVHGLNRPVRKVSGDFFDYLSLPDGRFPFALGDVSGKGMNAALLMAKTASLFRCLAKSIADPAALLRALNREIVETATRGMFVTMVAGVYDPVSGVLRFANAGHEPPLLRRRDRNYRTFPAASPPIGLLPDLAVETQVIEIDGGEFYIFTDGLTEFGYGDGEVLGVRGLIQMLEVSADTPLADRLQGLLAELDRHGWEARDDLTVLTIDGTWVRHDG